jgi:hypothetical protein
MGRIILGVIVGFIVWSVVWVGSDALLSMISPEWFGRYSLNMQKSFADGSPFEIDNTISAIHLVRSFITSILGGYMAALVAGEYKRSTMILGVLLVLVGLPIVYVARDYAPLWYAVLFIIFLIPMTILGGRLRRSN